MLARWAQLCECSDLVRFNVANRFSGQKVKVAEWRNGIIEYIFLNVFSFIALMI